MGGMGVGGKQPRRTAGGLSQGGGEAFAGRPWQQQRPPGLSQASLFCNLFYDPSQHQPTSPGTSHRPPAPHQGQHVVVAHEAHGDDGQHTQHAYQRGAGARAQHVSRGQPVEVGQLQVDVGRQAGLCVPPEPGAARGTSTGGGCLLPGAPASQRGASLAPCPQRPPSQPAQRPWPQILPPRGRPAQT